MKQPGMMIYFDAWAPIMEMDDGAIVRMLRAALRYTSEGTEPDFSGHEKMAWGLLRIGLDRDSERYAEVRDKHRYAVWCRERKVKGLAAAPFDQWRRQDAGSPDGASAAIADGSGDIAGDRRDPTVDASADTAAASAAACIDPSQTHPAEDGTPPGPPRERDAALTGAPCAADTADGDPEAGRALTLAQMLAEHVRGLGIPVSDAQLAPWRDAFARLHERGYRNNDMRLAILFLGRSRFWRSRVTSVEDFAKNIDRLVAQAGGGSV